MGYIPHNSPEDPFIDHIKHNTAVQLKFGRHRNSERKKMQNQEKCGASCEFDDWSNFEDEDIMQQQSDIKAEEAQKVPFVADKEPLSALASEYQSGSPILLEKIKVLGEQYAAIRRTRGDGNCFFRSFMFSYLEHILASQDQAEVDRIKAKVEECRRTLQSLGHADFTFEDFFASPICFERFAATLLIDLSLASKLFFIGVASILFLEQLDNVLQGNESSIRFVTSGEIRKRSEFFEPFILGLTNATVEQFCKSSVEPMGEESDHVHITALSDALGVPIRVVYLDRSSCDSGGASVNHHDFIPTPGDCPNATSGSTETTIPFITLLYRPGHYDILYPK
ncbi:OVARIAN TUMOR DOMAIN-containing deubiquitinating enzyme 1 [Citrus sinensis]|nr:OVARIAN TUMOR DOMAIN-containing deubiquitinating enzyme 1 [Citrus sinensis]